MPQAAQQQPAEVLHRVLAAFPPVQHAFAYGSGVFKQPGLYEAAPTADHSAAAAPAAAPAASGDRPMLDFIFAVEDPVAWHEENLRRHASHYSFLRHLMGPAGLTAVAERLGAGVYFNTLVPWSPGQLVKYGVVRLAALQADLLRWTTLYCAGRLHKPVATLASHPAVEEAQRRNLLSALRAALLLLPPRFETEHLLHAICALSYSGDVRMGLAEDSRKVHRIVAGSEAGLQQLYAAPLATAQRDWAVLSVAGGGGGDAWARDDSPAAAQALAAGLPRHVLEQLAQPLGVPLAGQMGAPLLPPTDQQAAAEQASGQQTAWQQRDEEQQTAAWQEQQGAGGQQPGPEQQQLALVARALAACEPQKRARLLRQAIHVIVGRSSRRQAVSGFLTAGVAKSVRYGLAKLKKAWR